MTAGRSGALARAGATMLIAILADQLVKAIVRGSVSPGETVSVLPGVDIVRVANDGVAFGLFDSLSSGVLILVAIAFTVVLSLVLMREIDTRPLLWLPIGLLAGGAIGNLIDRIRDGYVTDFIQLPHWPAFNVADVEITVGVLILAWMLVAEPGR